MKRIALATLLIFLSGAALYTYKGKVPRVKSHEPIAEASEARMSDSGVAQPRTNSTDDVYSARDKVAEKVMTGFRTETATSTTAYVARRIRAYRQLSTKVLKTDKERELWNMLLEDPKMQMQALGSLNPATPEADRMTLVDYLHDAMKNEAEKKRATLAGEVRKVLANDALVGMKDKKTLKSLAGDRIELMITLLEVDPGSAKELRIENAPLINQRIYQYAFNYKKGRI